MYFVQTLQRHCTVRRITRQIILLHGERYLSNLGHLSATYVSNNKYNLRRAFDDQTYWNDIIKERAHATTHMENVGIKDRVLSKFKRGTVEEKINSTGLFNNPYLTSPKGLKQFSQESLKYAKNLVEKMKQDKTEDGLLKYIVRLDQLSDTLCRVIDLCEFIRSVHPDEKFINSAQQCHEEMFEFMNVLNTDVELCNTLRFIMSSSEILNKLSKEEIKVGRILLDDFEKSGIYMDPETRNKFISISQDISVIGQDFINNIGSVENEYINIAKEDLTNSNINPLIINQLSMDSERKHFKVPCYGNIPYIFLRSCNNENVRRQIWSMLHSSSSDQITRLTHLIKLRAILANMMGKKSYAEYQLDGKMAKNPQNVQNFIKSLMIFTKPVVAKELKFIADLKSKDMNMNISEGGTNRDILECVRPWDRDYYSVIKKSENEKSRMNAGNKESISSYFTLGSVIEGLSDLFSKIYGISFELAIPSANETWDNSVRKILIKSEGKKGGIVGILYCDLFERAGKTTSPAHFTICCSREIYPRENNLSIMQIGESSNGVKFQLPIISVVCNFPRANDKDNNSDTSLLQLSEIETLFHEMGHAMHSMLGRTRLQNISGTRCATDFVELPSILMEHFARDKRVLSRIGRHHVTNEPVPDILLSDRLNESRFLQNSETFAQAKMSMLDQRLHDGQIIDDIENVDVVQIYQELERSLQVLVDDQTNWCGRFGHLFGYGASYYSYLFDRAIASKVWNKLFEGDPYSRASGEKFRDSVLKWGGLRNPWECIADVLDEPSLRDGDSEAMECIAEARDL